MKQKRLGKGIAAWLMCLAMVLTTINLPAFTTEVKAAAAHNITHVDSTLDDYIFEEGITREQATAIAQEFLPSPDSSKYYYFLYAEENGGYWAVFCEGGSWDYNVIKFSKYRLIEDALLYTYGELYVIGTTTSNPDNLIRLGNSDVYYKYENGTLTLSGSGSTPNYEVTYGKRSPFQNKKKIKNIVIESGVTNIGDELFSYMKELTGITIADTVRTIGANAFYGDDILTSVTIPASVNHISKYAFRPSNTGLGLKTVEFKGKNCYIDTNAFFDIGARGNPITLIVPSNWSGGNPNEYSQLWGGYFKLSKTGAAYTPSYPVYPFTECTATMSNLEVFDKKMTEAEAITYMTNLPEGVFTRSIGAGITDYVAYGVDAGTGELLVLIYNNGWKKSSYTDTLQKVKDALKNISNIHYYVIGSIVDNHTCSVTKITGKTATCTEAGWNDYYQCTDNYCGKYYEDENATTLIPAIGYWKLSEGKIAAGTHSYTDNAEVVKIDGTKHGKECSICHQVVETGNHDFSDQGDGIHTCADCGVTEKHDFLLENGTNNGAEKCTLCNVKNIASSSLDIKATSTTYTGKEQTAVITGIEAKNYTVTGNTATNAGKYTITLTGKGDYTGTREVEWTIMKATPTVVPPTSANPKYAGESVELVNPGSTDFGKMLYSLDDDDYSEEIPCADKGGDYTVYYEVEGSDNWSGAAGSVEIQVPVRVDVTVVGNGSVSGYDPDEFYPVGTVLTLTAEPDEDYRFTGWDDDIDAPAERVWTVLADAKDNELTVNFQHKNHDFTEQPYVADEDGIHHNQKCKYCDHVEQGNHDFSDEATKCKLCDVCKSVAENGNHNFSDGICVNCGLVDELAVFFKTYEGLVTVEHDSEHPWAMQPGDNSSLIPGWYDSYAISSMKITAVKHVVLSFSYSFWNTGDSTVLWVDKNGCNQYQQLYNDNSSYETELQPGEYLLICFMYQECFDDGVTLGDFSVYENHDFSIEDTKNKEALAYEATCTEPAKYYKSCACGVVSEQEEDIVEVGEPLGHTYENAVLTAKGNVVEAHCGRLVAKVENGEQVQGPCGELLGCATINATAENKVIKTGETTTLQLSVEKGEGYGSETSGLLGELTDCQWYLGEITAEDEIVGKAIEGANENTYQLPTDLTPGTYTYVCVAKCDGCEVKTSVSIVVEQSLAITTQPKAVTATEGTNATFKVAATGTGLTYKWQYSQNNGSTWIKSGAASAVTDTYILGAKASRNGYLIRCIVKDANGETVTTAAVKLTVKPAGPVITTQPEAVTATEGTNATFKVAVTGTGLTYQWQYSQNNGSTWIKSGAASSVTDTYVLGAKASRNGYLIRCIVKDANGETVTTAAVKLTVKPAGPVITTQPKAVTATEGTNATFKVAATGTGLTYQWQYSQNNGSTWIKSGATSSVTDTYILGAKASRNGYLIRCIIKDANGETVTSEAVKMTVKPAGPVITTQPEAVTATEGTNATFKVAATGTGLTYQWQYSQNNGSTWIKSGAASSVTDTYILGAKASRNGYLIRCIIKDANGETVTSAAVKMTVKPAGPVITTQPEAVTATEGTNATFKIAVTGTGLTYQWQYSQDNGTTWKNSSAASSVTASYVLGAKASRNGYLIRCIVKDANGETVTSEAVKMTVKPAAPVITTQPEAVTATEGTNATFKVAATGTGLTYQWQYSQDNGSTWKNSSAASSVTASYVLGAKASRNGYLIRCIIKDANGETVTSEAVKLTVKPAGPVITAQPEAVTAVEGKNATFKVAVTGTGLTYQWQYSQDNGSTWKNSSAASSVTDTYVLGAKASRNGYLIRCVVTDANGQVVTSEAVKLTVTK